MIVKIEGEFGSRDHWLYDDFVKVHVFPVTLQALIQRPFKKCSRPYDDLKVILAGMKDGCGHDQYDLTLIFGPNIEIEKDDGADCSNGLEQWSGHVAICKRSNGQEFSMLTDRPMYVLNDNGKTLEIYR